MVTLPGKKRAQVLQLCSSAISVKSDSGKPSYIKKKRTPHHKDQYNTSCF